MRRIGMDWAFNRRLLYWLPAALALVMGLCEWRRQRQEDRFIASLAARIVEQVAAADDRARVIALRDHVRTHVTWRGAPYHDRPVLRETAVETLQSGKGYCGEDTRAFIHLATALGIAVRRINLYGKWFHVVAEADLGDGSRVIVDCQQPPQVVGLERLDQVLQRAEFDDYATLHLSRWNLNHYFKGEIGPLTWWLESPHAMKSGLWFLLAVALINAQFLLKSRKPAVETLSEIRHMTELSNEFSILRCPDCAGELSLDHGSRFVCLKCREPFPIGNGIPRLLPLAMRQALVGENNGRIDPRRVATAESFGYEWTRFPEMQREWERNFRDYLAPHAPESLRGKQVLDAGCGSGRHAFYAAKFGAEVWAADIGAAVEVARRNNAESDSVRVVQADLHALPFATESFDLVYSIGVLHHLPDPEAVFRNLLRYVKPGGWIHVYLYWKPEGQPVKQVLLSLVTAIRRVTTRIPHRLLYYLSYPAAMGAIALFVWPYRLLSAAGLSRIAERLPMKQYAQYPFRVCVNDQFDRFSAPIEYRYTRREVTEWFERAGLEEISVAPNFGWVGSGRKPIDH